MTTLKRLKENISKFAKKLMTGPYIANPQGIGNYMMIDDQSNQIVIVDRKGSIKRFDLPKNN